MPIINPNNTISEGSIGQVLRNNSGTNNQNPIVYSQDIQGGLTTVNTALQRRQISARKLQQGMIVYEADNNRYYRFRYDTGGMTPVSLRLNDMGRFERTDGDPYTPASGSFTLEASWELIQFNADEPAIRVNTTTNMPEFDPAIDADEVRNLLQINPQGAILSFTLTTTDSTFTGGTWTYSTGVITHSDITQGAIVFLNGTQLQEGATADYQVDDAANTITLSSDIRTAIVDTQEWCVTVLDEVDSGTAGTGTGRLVDRRANRQTATVTAAQLTNIVTTPIQATPILFNGTQVANYTITRGATATPQPYIIQVDTTVAGWTVETITHGGTELDLTIVPGDDHDWFARFDGEQDIVINIVNTDNNPGIYYENSTDNFEARLDNVSPDIGELQGLGFDTIDHLDDRYVQQNSTDPYQQQSEVNTLISNALPITFTRGANFDSVPNPTNGDQHYLTDDIFSTNPTTTDVTSTPVTMSVARPRTAVQVATPVTNVMVDAGFYEVITGTRPATPVSTARTLQPSPIASYTFNRGFVRDRSFRGVEVRTSTTNGGNVVQTSVVEHQYDNVTITSSDGLTNVPIVGGVLRDYHYRQTVRVGTGGFASVRANVHYIVITSTDSTSGLASNSINDLLTPQNAISMIEGFIQDQSGLEIDLVQGESLPTSFSSSGIQQHTGVNLLIASSTPVDTVRYLFTPATDSVISTATINSIAQTPDSTTGIVDVTNDGPVQSWSIAFTRTFPTTTTDRTHRIGQYLYTNDSWQIITTSTDTT